MHKNILQLFVDKYVKYMSDALSMHKLPGESMFTTATIVGGCRIGNSSFVSVSKSTI